MPVENERKYVLDDHDGSLEGFLQGGAVPGVAVYDVLQGYLDRDSRVRVFRPAAGSPGGMPFRFCGSDPAGWQIMPGDELVFSFKRKVAGRQIEVECPLQPSDMAALLPTAAMFVRKRRFKIADGHVAWDIDFFKDPRGASYFALAEAEMPEGMVSPRRMPGFVRAHMLLDVGSGGGFGNRKLADPEQVRKAVRLLRKQATARGDAPSCDPADYFEAGTDGMAMAA